MNAVITASMVAVSALLPSKACRGQREPGRAGEQSDGDLRVQPAFLGEPGYRNPSPASISKRRADTS